jgi:CxxC-x17-CxxC domain-containing protein
MEFGDKILRCADCESSFVFTADEQVFFHTKQFIHEPKRCKPCRAKRSMKRLRALVETITTCAACGREATVPFRPTKGLPVLCRSCFQSFGDLRLCESQSHVARMMNAAREYETMASDGRATAADAEAIAEAAHA